MAVCSAPDPLVVEEDQLSVRGEPDVEFDPTAAEFPRFAQPGKCVFRRGCRGAPMAYYPRKYLGELGPC